MNRIKSSSVNGKAGWDFDNGGFGGKFKLQETIKRVS